MKNSLIKITGSGQEDWYESEAVGQISDAAGLLDKVLRTAGQPSAAAMEHAAGGSLLPMEQEDYATAVEEFLALPGDGLLVEIDLGTQQASFTYWGIHNDQAYQIYAPLDTVAGVYEASVDQATGALDGNRFFNELVCNSAWHSTAEPAEHIPSQMQEQGSAQGMAMM